MRALIIAGAVAELVVAVLAFALAGPMALVAALAGAAVAFGAQVAAVAILRPAMRSDTREFTQRWGAGMAIRFASFLVVATVILALRDVLPPIWVAAGYLAVMLVLLLGETRFLK